MAKYRRIFLEEAADRDVVVAHQGEDERELGRADARAVVADDPAGPRHAGCRQQLAQPSAVEEVAGSRRGRPGHGEVHRARDVAQAPAAPGEAAELGRRAGIQEESVR